MRERICGPVVTARDRCRLERLIAGYEPRADDALMRPLRRKLMAARVVASEQVAPDVVTMRSRVQFRRHATGEIRTMTLVYPGDEDELSARLSVLSPAGAALLGLRPGQSVVWLTPSGRPVGIAVERVLYQPEAAGRYDL